MNNINCASGGSSPFDDWNLFIIWHGCALLTFVILTLIVSMVNIHHGKRWNWNYDVFGCFILSLLVWPLVIVQAISKTSAYTLSAGD